MAHDASTKRHLGYTKLARMSIGHKTFIGMGTIILPSVNIGETVVIGAGSVIAHDISDNSVAFGNPARVAQSVTEYIERHSASMKKRPVCPDRGWTLGNGITDENRRTMQEALADGLGYVE